MAVRRLDTDQVLNLCKAFIKERGYAIRLNIDENTKSYLLRYQYIYDNENVPGYYCLSDKFFKNYKKVIEGLSFNRIELELLKNYSALRIIYFDEEIMHLFLNNPKFRFEWDGYSGYLYSTEDSKIDISIKDICLAHDLEDNKVVLGMLTVDLIDLPEASQLILQPFMLDNSKDKYRYELHPYNIKNKFFGEWLDIKEENVYSVILEGIKIVNYIFNSKHGFNLFNNEYELSDLQFYMPIFYPTKINMFNFMLELAKIFLDNINESSLKKKIKREYELMKNKGEFSLDDLDRESFRGLKLFKTYFRQYDLFNMMSYEKLDKIRKTRTEPAHKIYKNDLDYTYCKEQDDVLKDLYRVLYNIMLAEDPKHEYIKKYKNGDYLCFYGDKGGILERNGFNNKPYKYFDGYIRLLNDKFDVRDAEILMATNDRKLLKKTLKETILNNSNINEKDVDLLVNSIINNKDLVPTERELRSFFYGNAFKAKIYGYPGNYKINGEKMYSDFVNKEYKYILALADSTDLMWGYEKIIEYLKADKDILYGSGLLMISLSNNFAQDKTNLFNNHPDGIFIDNNTWD